MELTDADLVARVLVDEDQHAFSELVRRHQSSVRGLLRQLTRTDFALADDLCAGGFSSRLTNISEAFVERLAFRPGSIGLPIMFFARTPAAKRNSSGSMRTFCRPNRTRSTVDPGLRQDLMHALSLLPLHERTAVLLCCQNGLSHDEASRVLDIPLGTVKTNVLRGREKLKKTLAAWATR